MAWKASPQAILLFVLFVDLFAVAVVLPIIPTYATQLGLHPSTIGLLGSLYGLAQLLGAPVMGSISDAYGRNVVLLISCAGTCASYLAMAFSRSVALLFLLRLPVGYVRQTVTAASAYISDSTSVEQRTIALGKVQTVMSAAFLVGPICSGITAQRDPSLALPIYIATASFVVELVALRWALPDSRTLLAQQHALAAQQQQQQQSQALWAAVPAGHPTVRPNADDKLPLPCPFSMDQQKAMSGGSGATAADGTPAPPPTFWGKLRANFATLVRFVHDPASATYLLTFFVFTFALTASRESLFVSLQSRYDVSAAHIGYIWGYVAFLGMVVQGTTIGPLTRRWSEDHLTRVCFVGLCAAHVAAGLAPTFRVWCAVMPAVAFFGGVLRTCVVGSLTKVVPRAQVGAMLGLTDFLTSMCRVVCPFFGGVLTQYFGANSTDYLVALLAISMFFHLSYGDANRPKTAPAATTAAAAVALATTTGPTAATGTGGATAPAATNGADSHIKAS